MTKASKYFLIIVFTCLIQVFSKPVDCSIDRGVNDLTFNLGVIADFSFFCHEKPPESTRER